MKAFGTFVILLGTATFAFAGSNPFPKWTEIPPLRQSR